MGCDVKQEEIYQNGAIMHSYQWYVRTQVYNTSLSNLIKHQCAREFNPTILIALAQQ